MSIAARETDAEAGLDGQLSPELRLHQRPHDRETQVRRPVEVEARRQPAAVVVDRHVQPTHQPAHGHDDLTLQRPLGEPLDRLPEGP